MTTTDHAPAGSDAAIARMMSLQPDSDVVDLSIGEPDQPLPAPLAETAIASLREGRTGYTAKLGIPELREAIAVDTGDDVAVEGVVVTAGGTGAVALAIMAAGAAGLVVPDPTWPNYLVFAEQLGYPVRRYRQGPSGDDFLPLDEIEAGLRDGCRLVVINSPSNPTGAVASAGALAALVELARRHGATILSDEAYESIVFSGGRAPSPLDVGGADVTFAARTFSKRFSMTGLRLGSIVSPARFRRDIGALHGTTAGCAPVTAQIVGLEALNTLADRGAELSAVYRDRWVRAASVLGDRLASPSPDGLGGFYLWIDARDTGRTEEDLVAELSRRSVAVSAGSVYSAQPGFLRASLTAPDDRLDDALATIAAVLDGA